MFLLAQLTLVMDFKLSSVNFLTFGRYEVLLFIFIYLFLVPPPWWHLMYKLVIINFHVS